MAVLVLKGTDAQDNEAARGAYLNAWVRSKEAEELYPGLTQNPHVSNIQDVKSEVTHWLGFQEIKKTNGSSNFYETHRKMLKGIGPGTSLAFRLYGQRNFTKNDAAALESHLVQIFPNLKINVSYHPSTPRCVVHVGL